MQDHRFTQCLAYSHSCKASGSSLTSQCSGFCVPYQLKCVILFACLACVSFSTAFAQDDENISRALLIDMAQQQYTVLCASQKFASCIGFSGAECKTLADSAIKQCLLVLPDEISPDNLDNAALESCPQQIFADAGFSEERAGICFDAAMEDNGS